MHEGPDQIPQVGPRFPTSDRTNSAFTNIIILDFDWHLGKIMNLTTVVIISHVGVLNVGLLLLYFGDVTWQ